MNQHQHPSVFNFGAGPACLPQAVLRQIKNDIPDWFEGMSVMEIGHRTPVFKALIARAEAKLRAILDIPDHFRVLFMQGGARAQFAAIGLNLFTQSQTVDYLVTGHWSKVAAQEAEKYTRVRVLVDGEAIQYKSIPSIDKHRTSLESKYVYYTDNETIHGVAFREAPDVEPLLISDMTSSIVTKKIDWQKHALVFASAQKNLGIAGVTVVVVREDQLGHVHPLTPSVLDYNVMTETQSLYNTSPVFALYVLDLILSWVEQKGGLLHFEEKAQQISQKLYAFIDNSALYYNDVEVSCRSPINIPFNLSKPELTESFGAYMENNRLKALKGHRSVGGYRASLYNAMPIEGVNQLIDHMQRFERENA